MKFSRKKAAHAVLAWTLSLALAAPAVSTTAFAATDNTTQTQQTTDTQGQQPPQPPQGAQNGQPPMGPPPDGSTPPGPPPNGQAPNGQQGQPPQGAPGQQQGKSASELTAAKVVDGTYEEQFLARPRCDVLRHDRGGGCRHHDGRRALRGSRDGSRRGHGDGA